MGFTKYQRVESSAPLSKREHEDVEEELRKAGKASMSDMTNAERKIVSKRLDSSR